MSNYPQDKFTAPDISGEWKYYGNTQAITQDGISPITTITGILDINQDNLFFNYVNKELNLNRVGVFVQNTSCINGKTNIKWEARVVNNTDDGTISLYPYCYKKGKPTKITGINVVPGPVQVGSPTYVRTTYYEKI
jgi:hypothetical protein